jgi:hypothetical protein
VGKQTAGTVLDTVWQNHKVAPAPVGQGVQRAVAEQAVELFRVRTGMAREIFTVAVRKTGVMRRHDSALPSVIRAWRGMLLFYANSGRCASPKILCGRMEFEKRRNILLYTFIK